LNTVARYGVVGGLSFLVDYGVTVLLVQFLPLLVANTLGFACANVFNFLLAHFWVFRGGRGAGELARAYVSVLAISMMGLFLNDLIVWIMVKRLELPLLFGKITAAGLVMLWNYFARVTTVYRKQH
jgi:putative flippase GtrA